VTEVFTIPPNQPEIVRDLTPEELRQWLPYVGTLSPGVRAVWVDLLATSEWAAVPDGLVKVCRFGQCRNRAVVERRRHTGRQGAKQWWAYCAEHAAGEYQPGDRPKLLTRRIALAQP
jgi:hypothetical protein